MNGVILDSNSGKEIRRARWALRGIAYKEVLMKCESCGSEINPAKKFCTSCGAPVKRETDFSVRCEKTGNTRRQLDSIIKGIVETIKDVFRVITGFIIIFLGIYAISAAALIAPMEWLENKDNTIYSFIPCVLIQIPIVLIFSYIFLYNFFNKHPGDAKQLKRYKVTIFGISLFLTVISAVVLIIVMFFAFVMTYGRSA